MTKKIYPYKFAPIYKEKIWGGRSLERLYGRDLPDGAIGESWELADLQEGTSIVSNGPLAGTSLTQLTADLGSDLLGAAKPLENGRFPLLLKILDANDILSLQVHPDSEAVEQIGPPAALKTECWYAIESRDGYIYKGIKPDVTPQQFRQAIESDTVEQLVKKYQLQAGDFHFLPAGTVHAVGAGLLVAEVQTPSDTTYRVTDWGRGREIHVERSMQCIHFSETCDQAPGAGGDTLLVTEFFTVNKHIVKPGESYNIPDGKCVSLMLLDGPADMTITHAGPDDPTVKVIAGDTVVIPAACKDAVLQSSQGCCFLEVFI